MIDDSALDARLIGEMLKEKGSSRFRLECTDRLSEGLKRIARGRPDIILLDMLLPDSQGFETFTGLRRKAPGLPIIVLSGLNDEELAKRLMQEGARGYLVKGRVDSSILVGAIKKAMETR